jgi:hypothetical protein
MIFSRFSSFSTPKQQTTEHVKKKKKALGSGTTEWKRQF